MTDRLRELYAQGGDPAIERFPASDELFLVLVHAQRWASDLKQPHDVPVNIAGEAAVLRATLWQYLHEQADIGQLKAIEHGRAAGVPWHHFVEALCVTSRQGAYQKARRLKAEQLRSPSERRTPEVARAHEERAFAEARAEQVMVLAQERRFTNAHHVARRLLEHREGFALDDLAVYWLDELAETMNDRNDPAERARFTGWVESFVRAAHGYARQRGEPVTTTEDARQALALATEFTYQDPPGLYRQDPRSQTGNKGES
ncbi:hypothetical protein [Streptomyces sp. NBC_01497]|uniref:hypothetical protein n=1 Tax=Streptomyces sp. NBC_01497 TaxID=2903885 RepID=UPI002E358CFD|nr:hypothetical protein [Streptomyces sp. NBC_01497]